MEFARFKTKALLMGQSGAGKSTLLNAIYNESVGRAALRAPADIAATAAGVTSGINNYFANFSLLLTDTIGCDDNRFDPIQLAMDLRMLLRTARVGYTHIVLCLPRSRVTHGTRVCLAQLQTIFGPDFADHLILYISHCEDGSTVEDFIMDNAADPDLQALFERIRAVQARDGINRIIVGTMSAHRDATRDIPFQEDRAATLATIKALLARPFLPLHIRQTPLEAILHIYFTFIEKIFRVKRSVKQVLEHLVANAVSLVVTNHFPTCTICMEDNYDSAHRPAMIACGHIFHQPCLDTLPQPLLCPSCRREFQLPGDELPLNNSMSAAD